MSGKIDVEDVELSDAELITVLKNHGMSRRWLMRVFGAGAVVTALGGTASASRGKGTRIHKVYGAPYEASESVPSGLVDHEVELHIHPGPGAHPGFPLEGGGEFPAEFFFEPVGLRVKPGEIVEFKIHHGLHTVTSIHSKFNEPPFLDFPDRVPTANGFTSPPINTDDSWLYRFTTKGVYDIMCLPHLRFGMVVRLVVIDDGDPVPADYGPLPFPNAGDVLAAPELMPGNIVSEGSVAWADLTL